MQWCWYQLANPPLPPSEIAPSASSKQLVAHAVPTDAPARRGENLINICTQFPLETVIQLLQEAGVDLPADTSTIASG